MTIDVAHILERQANNYTRASTGLHSRVKNFVAHTQVA